MLLDETGYETCELCGDLRCNGEDHYLPTGAQHRCTWNAEGVCDYCEWLEYAGGDDDLTAGCEWCNGPCKDWKHNSDLAPGRPLSERYPVDWTAASRGLVE